MSWSIFEKASAPNVAEAVSGGDTQWLASVNAGLIPGWYTDSAEGYNNNLDSGAQENLWNEGVLYVWPNRLGEPMEIVSDNASDTGIPIVIRGLDGAGIEIVDIVTLNGTTPVQTSLTFGRINFAIVFGETEIQGIVRIRAAGGGSVYSRIEPENQQSLQLIYTIPSNKNGFFLPAESTINRDGGGSNTGVILRTRVRRPGGVFWTAGRWGLQKTGTSAFLFKTGEVPLLTPWLDIMVTAESNVNNVDVTGRVPLLLMDSP